MKQIWKCDYCDHTCKVKKEMIKHEKECYGNPKNQKCVTCGHPHMWGWCDKIDDELPLGRHCDKWVLLLMADNIKTKQRKYNENIYIWKNKRFRKRSNDC